MKKQYYSNYGNIQVLISLLHQYGIKNIVISAGNRHSPFVHSLENEKNKRKDCLNIFSVVDERSASFVAIGLIQKLHEPVAICCTSGTAACNYVSAVQEAFFQKLPLIVLTADRNPMYLYQQEEQMSVQQNLFSGACKKAVTLPIVRDEKDMWYCARLVNEALLEAVQGEQGPVHINFPVENDYPVKGGFMDFDTEKLPFIRKTERLLSTDSDEKWKEWAVKLHEKKLLIIYGQNRPLNNDELKITDTFCSSFNCVFSVDALSNLNCSKSIDTTLLSRIINKTEIEELLPDVIITMNGNSISGLKGKIPVKEKNIQHIHISENGLISDPYKCLPDTIACSPIYFFERIVNYISKKSNDSYFKQWNKLYKNKISLCDFNSTNIEWSSLYTIQQVMNKLPENSLLHLANSNSVRLCSLFPNSKYSEVYCNRGTNGIDGSMSSFVGNSIFHNGLCFLFIGDLSFFYDMNALWNHHLNKKIRILVNNNAGGAIFYTYPSLKNIPTLADNIAAEHNSSVKAWSVDRGFTYLSAKNKDELLSNLDLFFNSESETPVILECFTDKEMDAKVLENIPSLFMDDKTKLKKSISKHINPELKKAIKKIIR